MAAANDLNRNGTRQRQQEQALGREVLRNALTVANIGHISENVGRLRTSMEEVRVILENDFSVVQNYHYKNDERILKMARNLHKLATQSREVFKYHPEELGRVDQENELETLAPRYAIVDRLVEQGIYADYDGLVSEDMDVFVMEVSPATWIGLFKQGENRMRNLGKAMNKLDKDAPAVVHWKNDYVFFISEIIENACAALRIMMPDETNEHPGTMEDFLATMGN